MFCQCGCGAVTRISPRNDTTHGSVKGQHAKHLPGHNRPWVRGYKTVLRGTVCIPLHKMIVERALGRPIPRGAEIHHLDENFRNNSNSNLVVCQDRAYHKLLHVRARVLRSGGDPDTERVCWSCKICKPFCEFYRSVANVNTGITNICRVCSRRRVHEMKQMRIAEKGLGNAETE